MERIHGVIAFRRTHSEMIQMRSLAMKIVCIWTSFDQRWGRNRCCLWWFISMAELFGSAMQILRTLVLIILWKLMWFWWLSNIDWTFSGSWVRAMIIVQGISDWKIKLRPCDGFEGIFRALAVILSRWLWWAIVQELRLFICKWWAKDQMVK